VVQPLPLGLGEVLRQGRDAVAIIALGSRVHPAWEAAKELAQEGLLDVTVFNARFVKPLPEDQLLELAREHRHLLVVEENVVAGGFGSAVLELFARKGVLGLCQVELLGLPDAFVEHGPQRLLRSRLGLDKNGIKRTLCGLLGHGGEQGIHRSGRDMETIREQCPPGQPWLRM